MSGKTEKSRLIPHTHLTHSAVCIIFSRSFYYRSILSCFWEKREERCHDHCVPQLTVGDRWCFHVFLFCILHFETAFSARKSIFLFTHFVVCVVIFISRAVHAPFSRIQICTFFIHTYSVTDKNNIQDFHLGVFLYHQIPSHRVSRDRWFFI